MGKFIDLTGQRFGRLTVVERVENNKRNKAMWLCRCDCGKQTVVIGDLLRNGATKSCGCIRVENILMVGKQRCRHRETGTRLHKIWISMKFRCLNTKAANYPRYGGRGITVCEEWQCSYEAFRDWALTNGYNDTLTIDRINMNGNYEPTNCRWATSKEQSKNRRNTRLLTLNDKTQCVADWSKELGLCETTIFSRLSAGWTVEEALITPVGQRRKTK